MKVLIMDRVPGHTDMTVRFSSKIGAGTAIWKGRDDPVAGQLYDIEFEVLPSLQLGINAAVVEDGEPEIRTDGRRNWLVGTIEAIDSDGMAFLRAAIDCLAMVESSGPLPAVGQQVELTIDVPDFHIHVTGS